MGQHKDGRPQRPGLAREKKIMLCGAGREPQGIDTEKDWLLHKAEFV